MKNLINDPRLGGDVVNRNPHKVPQRKPEKAMSGEELLNKAIHGTHKPKHEEVWNKVLNKR